MQFFSFLSFRYMKYLYPYECEKLKLSNPSELQAAIDGNRREGRRPSYGGYEFTPVPTMIPTTPPHLNGAALLNGRPPAGSSPAGLWSSACCCWLPALVLNIVFLLSCNVHCVFLHKSPPVTGLFTLFVRTHVRTTLFMTPQRKPTYNLTRK